MTYILVSGHPASAHQSAIFDFLQDRRGGSANVIAVAGSGKTTTAVNCLTHIPEQAFVQIFAFNVSIVKEMKERVAELERATGRSMLRTHVGTFHSVGGYAVAKSLGKSFRELEIDDRKCAKILRTGWLDNEELKMYGAFCSRLVGFAKGEGIGCLVPDTDERWHDIIETQAMYLEHQDAELPRAVMIARTLLRLSNEASKRGIIDFADMLYLPLLWKLRLFPNDWVLVDEAQDTNPCRRAIAKLALRPGGRLLAFGDPRQSIYGFTGATQDAMELIAHDFKARELPLTVSYRCPKRVVEHAQQWVDYIQSHDAADEGSVIFGATFDDILADLTADDAVLCRNSAPLVGLAYRLIAKGRACRMRNREIGEGLIDLIKAMKAKGIDALLEKLEAFRQRETARLIAKGNEPAAEGVEDRVACVEIIIQNLSETDRTVPALIRRIEAMFEAPNGRVLTLSTCHGAKGLEWPQVAILEPGLMPSKWARTEAQYEAEVNIQYVAATRAKRRLIYMAGGA